jgi:Tat protein translocase TatB subunit
MDILGIGFWELVIIFIVAMMVFGPRRLPEYAAKAGKFIRDLRNMSQGLMTEWQREIMVATRLDELQEIRKELDLTRQELNQTQQQISQQTKKDIDEAQKDISAIKEQVTATASNVSSVKESKESETTATISQKDTLEETETTAQESETEEKSNSPNSQEQTSTPVEQSHEDSKPTESTPDAGIEPESVEVNGRNNTSTEAVRATVTSPKPSETPSESKETLND